MKDLDMILDALEVADVTFEIQGYPTFTASDLVEAVRAREITNAAYQAAMDRAGVRDADNTVAQGALAEEKRRLLERVAESEAELADALDAANP